MPKKGYKQSKEAILKRMKSRGETASRKGKYKKCLRCKKIFYEFPYQKGKKKFCSTNCANKANAKRNSESKMGKNNPMYGKTPWNYSGGIRKKTENRYTRMSEKEIKISRQKGIEKWKKSIIGTEWGKHGFKKGNKTKTQFKKGHTSWGKDKKMSKEFCEKVTAGKLDSDYTHNDKTRQKIRLAHLGEKNYNWRGGVTKEDRKRFSDYRWRRIATKIRKKFNYTCQDCGKKPVYEVHHKIPWRVCKNNNEDNLVLLCKSCHVKRERKIDTKIFKN